MTFVFPDYDHLRLALTGGAVPVAVTLAPARAGVDPQSRPWVTPPSALPQPAFAALRRLGVQVHDGEPCGGGDVAHWLQVLPLRRDTTALALTDQTPILFELDDAEQLTALVGEMLRLGNDRQAFRWLAATTKTNGQPSRSTVLLRVVGPPYYSLLRALDRNETEAVRAYAERSANVWVELGSTHPLGDMIRAPDGQIVLLRAPSEWRYLDESPTRDIYDVLEFALPDRARAWADAPPSGKLTVPLRLAPAAVTERPELWVLRGDGLEQIDALVRDADDKLLARLAFAVGILDGQRLAVLRARPSKEGPPVLVLDALACRPYLRLPNLLLPVGSRLRPPLRRNLVRTLLAEDPARVTWLVAHDDGTFTPQSLPDDAFRPLTDWVEYVIDHASDSLAEWVRATEFDFAQYVSGDELVPVRAARERRPPAGPRDSGGAAPAPEAAPVPGQRGRGAKSVPASPAAATFQRPPTTPSELQHRLTEAEQRFLAVEGPLAAPARRVLWPELARLNSALGQTIDAAACWVSALWEPADPPKEWAWAWVRSEKALVQPELTGADVDRLLAHAQPTTPDLRPFAAAVVWAAAQKPPTPALLQRLPVIQRYLEQHDRLLPVRAAWLTWVGITRLAGADVLALVRARDRVLARLLTEGLSPERDLPGFLRFAGQRDANRLRLVRERAERLRQQAHAWFPASITRPGDHDQTPAYIDLMFAFGLARLSEVSASRDLLASATAAIERTASETHSVLLQAFQFRIEEALAGRPHAGALPAALIEYVDHLRIENDKREANNADADRSVAYIVDRLREQSRILEPQERFRPYRYTDKSAGDEVSKELATWPELTNPRQLRARIEHLLGPRVKPPLTGAVRVKVLSQAIALANRLGEEFALELIHTAPALIEAAVDRGPPDPYTLHEVAVLLERAIFFAAHYDDRAFVTGALERLTKLLDLSSGPAALEATASLVGQTLRGLRRFGMRDDAERLLSQVEQWVFRGQPLDRLKTNDHRWPQTLEMLLRLAIGWLDFDRREQARAVLDEAREFLLRGATGLTGGDILRYVSIVGAYITALGHGPVDEALARVDELLQPERIGKLPNTYTSSSHYSRFHLNIVEAIVLALASEEFALEPAARRWLDDDEYLVRRRIHHDVRVALSQAGLA